jgi:hypothetical protein
MFAVVVIAATGALSACGSDGATTDDATATAATDGVGSIGDAIEVAIEAPGRAGSATCDIERNTLATAVDAFYAMNGVDPVSEDELIAAQILRDPIEGYDLDENGSIVPAPTGPCT